MTIQADIVEDSIGPNKKRITTFVLKYPRYIHAEVMTHRMFSRNASSSRAMPLKAVRKLIRQDMAIPTHIGLNKRGMQADEEVGKLKKILTISLWKALGKTSLFVSWIFDKMNIHKQVANRIVEPWSHITVVLTATDFDNFFALRFHKDAQPEIYELAKKMHESMSNGSPKHLKLGEWHLPFITKEDRLENDNIDVLKKRSAAKCARVSYNNHDGSKSSTKQDLALYDRLMGSIPKHSSPTEHQAMACKDVSVRSGNLAGWIQFRKTIVDENILSFKKGEDGG